MSISTLTEQIRELEQETSAVEEASGDLPWAVVVWDDPINTMDYVSYVFQSYFGYSAQYAESLMLQVHTTGKAVVSRGPREKAETDMMAMHSFGLQATVRKESDV